MLRRVDGTQAGKDVEVVLVETHAVIFKAGWSTVVLVAANNPVFLRHAYDALHPSKAFDLCLV